MAYVLSLGLPPYLRECKGTARNISLIFLYSLLIFASFFRGGAAYAENTFPPILPLQYPKASTIPLLEEAMRDPSIFKRAVKDDAQVAGFLKENKELTAKLKAAKAKSQVKYAIRMMENHAAIAYYYADRLSGRFGGDSTNKYQQLMISSYKNVIEHATVVQSISKSPAEIATASYYIYSAAYIIGDSPKKNLEKLKPLTLKASNLPDRLVKNSLLILSINDIAHAKANAAETLEALITSLSVSGAISAKLALARFMAGLNARGEKTRTVDPNYQKLLFAASDKAFNVGERNQEKIFRFVLGVWRAAEGPKGSWKKPPLNDDRFKDFPELLAIKERDGLWEWSFGKRGNAVAIYSLLAQELRAQPSGTTLDTRSLDLEELLFRQSHNYVPFENHLVELRKRYRDEKLLGRDIDKDEKSFLVDVEKRHLSLVNTALAAAAAPQVAEKDRVDTIGLANRYLAVSNAKATAGSEAIETKIAGLWVLNKNYAKAVEIYLRLAVETQAEKKQYFYEQAIKSQRILAKWPVDLPWAGVEAGNATERKKLLAIYDSLNQLPRAKINWNIIGHLGHLHLNLNQVGPAFSLWDDAIHKSPQNPAAPLAAGMMLTSYLKAGNWPALENLARFTLLARMQPVFNKTPMSPALLLPFALVKGGDAAFKAGTFAIAVKKYGELVSKFSSKDDDYNYFMLASAYRGDGKHKDSIETLIEFTEKFQKSTYRRQALINGGVWSTPLAYEENAMFFCKEFLKNFPNDPEAQHTSDTLARLYLGRRLYAEAIALLGERTLSNQLAPQSKLAAFGQLMKVEYKFGSKAHAYQAADTILQRNPVGDLKSEALVIKARGQYTSRNVLGLQQIEAQLKTLGNSGPTVDSLGTVRYLLAEAKLGPMFESVNSNRVQNPIQAVFDRYNLFIKSQADYLYVCSTDEPSMCGPALHRLARFADRMIQLINDFQIPATLEEKVINDFIKRRTVLLTNLQKTSEDSDRRAAAIVVGGHTDPEWTNQILWKNFFDWNFDGTSGSAGSGFIQWDLKNES